MNNNVSFDSSLSKFGIGLFETIKIKDGIPIDLDEHLDRMYNSIEDININFKYEKEYIKLRILEYIRDNEIKNRALRITVFDEGYNLQTRDIVYNEESYKKGFKVAISPIKRGYSILHKYKTTNYFDNIYSKQYANSKGFDEGLFTNSDGDILECSMSNIFFIREHEIFTPSSELNILNGIMRQNIIKECQKNNIKFSEVNINMKDIHRFDFCFISNSLMGIMKVTNIEDVKFNDSNEVFEDIWSHIKNGK